MAKTNPKSPTSRKKLPAKSTKNTTTKSTVEAAAPQKTQPAKAKKDAWFVPVRGSYLPSNAAGRLMYLLFLLYLIFTAYFGLKFAPDHAVAVVFILYNWLAATALMTILAARKS